MAGRRVYVGRSSRTNANAVAQMRQLLAPLGYTVCDVEVRKCLHLKSAVTSLGDDLLLVNPDWITKHAFGGFEFVDVDPAEPTAANALRVGNEVIYAAAFPRTAERLAAARSLVASGRCERGREGRRRDQLLQLDRQ